MRRAQRRLHIDVRQRTVLSLNHGQNRFTAADCLTGAAVVAPEDSTRSGSADPGKSKGGAKKGGGSSPKQAGETCAAKQTDGTAITLKIEER